MMRGGGSAFGAGMRRGRGEGWGEAGYPFLYEYFISYIFMLSSFTPIILFFRQFQFLGPDFRCFIYIPLFLGLLAFYIAYHTLLPIFLGALTSFSSFAEPNPFPWSISRING